MSPNNNNKLFLSSLILKDDYIYNLKKEFEVIIGENDDDKAQPTTLEYLENFNEYFLKYPKKH